MILQSLHICNFGLYGGSHWFDLTPNPVSKRPIILVVGHNGSGKTTFLEAVRLVLYGKRALGPRIGQAEYEGYLFRRINNSTAERHAFIELSFNCQDLGTINTYVVRREWIFRGSSTIETLQFTRNGNPVNEIPREDWNHYLEDIFPPGVSQLFFFDGEKIQDIADDQNNTSLSEAIRSLLGLDIIYQLRGDLALYKSRRTDHHDAPDLEAIKRNLEAARANLVITEERIDSLSYKRTRFARQSEAAQRFFEQEGGVVALDRERLTDELKKVEIEFTKYSTTLKRLINGAGVFSLAPRLLARFSAEVKRAEDLKSNQIIKKFILDFKTSMKKSSKDLWTDIHFEALKGFSNGACNDDQIITLSTDPKWIIDKLYNIYDERDQVAALSNRLSELQDRRTILRDQIKNFRPGAANGAFDKLKRAEYKLGAIEAELSREKTKVSQLRALVERLERELRKAQDIIFDIARAEVQRDLATRSQAALNDFEKRILEKRLASLSQYFVRAFNGLVTRKEIVRDILVDPRTFHIRLFRSEEREILPCELSAGERQLFAISMLWALGRTSGRELPMIIDTPLSRLDRQHRIRLMSDYIPRTSNQVVMLCTDTELTPDLESIISAHVTRRYEIGVVNGGLNTTISPQKLVVDTKEAERFHAH